MIGNDEESLLQRGQELDHIGFVFMVSWEVSEQGLVGSELNPLLKLSLAAVGRTDK